MRAQHLQARPLLGAALLMLAASPAAGQQVDVRRLADTVSAILSAGVRDSAFPGAVAVIGTRAGVLVERAAGRLDWTPSPAPDGTTLWDLASLTKVVALTTAVMQLTERGLIDLDGPVTRYLPAFAGQGKERVTIRHLLTHSSGLPAWRPLYQEAPSADSALALVFATPLDTTPGARMVYSDLGAILLGEVVEQVTGQPFDRYVESQILAPLGMRETMFRPPPELHARVAPTEVDPWRGRHVRAEVHDENAYRLGGVSSHAGLFSTAKDLARFARMLLNGGTLDGARIVSPATIAEFTRVQNPAVSHRALGWETPNGTNSAGRRLSARAFGHTGFTGTSLWIDPENDVFIMLLSNRVNPTRERRGIFAVRVALADAVMSVIGKPAAGPTGGRGAPSPGVSWYPPRPAQGSLIRVTVTWPGVGSLAGTLAGEPLHFEQDSAGVFYAVGAVPVDAAAWLRGGVWGGSRPDSVRLTIPVAGRRTASERLRTAPEYTDPPDSSLAARIAAERAQIRAVYARAHEIPRIWSLWFSPPIRTRVTSAYGTRRVLNDETRSRHLGLDYDGEIGDPVRASNRGVVVLVGDFFYNGRCVYLSHGAGLITAYLHMSAVHVALGDTVERGQVIGEVGATGRVTGPHLHWAVYYGRLSVDPTSLLSLRPLPVAPPSAGQSPRAPPDPPGAAARATPGRGQPGSVLPSAPTRALAVRRPFAIPAMR